MRLQSLPRAPRTLRAGVLARTPNAPVGRCMNTKAPLTSSLLSLALALGGAALACDPMSADVEPRYDSNGAPDDGGCTLTQGYWKNHHAQADNPAQQQP